MGEGVGARVIWAEAVVAWVSVVVLLVLLVLVVQVLVVLFWLFFGSPIVLVFACV